MSELSIRDNGHQDNGDGWRFYVEGAEILICIPRDAVADLGEHVHLRLTGPTALLVAGGLQHLLEHDRHNGGELWASVEEALADAAK